MIHECQLRGLLIAVEWLSSQFLGYEFPCFLLIGRIWCHCRMVYLPIAYLYGKRFVSPIMSTIQSLRKELYMVPYHEIDWNEARNLCAKLGKNYTFSSPLSFLYLNFTLPHYNIFYSFFKLLLLHRKIIQIVGFKDTSK